MKRLSLCLTALSAIIFFACQKSNDSSQIALTPSASQVSVGEQLSVTLSAKANASNWTVTPSYSATKTYGLTTSKVNYFSFSQPGIYTISVRARSVAYDSTKNQSLDSCWNHGGGSRGGCTQGVDTASVAITVTGK